MKDLENKGINWTGNIYYKFEGIISDVNDTMIQDTFKYVENRVHNVGGNLKKFCSDVVGDFFPLSADPEKHEAKSVAPEENSAIISTDNCGSSETNVVETASDSVLKQSLVAGEAVDQAEGQRSIVYIGDELKNANFMKSHDVQDCISAPKRTNELTNENSDSSKKDVDDTKDVVDGPLGASSLDEIIETNHEGKSVVLPNVGLDTLARDSVSKGALCDVLSHHTESECDFYALSSLSENTCTVVSIEDASTGTGLVSTEGSPLRDFTSPPRYSSDISSPEALYRHVFVDLTGCVTDSPNGLLSSTPASAMPAYDGVVERQLVSSISHLSLESIDDSGVDVAAGSGMETINLHDEVKLGESCVFVDDTALYAVSRRARKLGSYKKKIQDIFASKKRLAKEYEQLAIWYGDTDMNSSPDTLNSQARESCDSEWELL